MRVRRAYNGAACRKMVSRSGAASSVPTGRGREPRSPISHTVSGGMATFTWRSPWLRRTSTRQVLRHTRPASSSIIQRYVGVNHRWNSPKFLFGESYGTTRSAALADALDASGMPLNGVVLMSTILNYFTMAPGSDAEFIGNLPSYAAIAWQFGKIAHKPADEKAFLNDVRADVRVCRSDVDDSQLLHHGSGQRRGVHREPAVVCGHRLAVREDRAQAGGREGVSERRAGRRAGLSF